MLQYFKLTYDITNACTFGIILELAIDFPKVLSAFGTESSVKDDQKLLSHLFYIVFPVAIEAILSYSESAVELLRRKKIRRDDLFQYLASERVVISPKSDKYDIIQKVLEYWGTSQLPNDELQKIITLYSVSNHMKFFLISYFLETFSYRSGSLIGLYGLMFPEKVEPYKKKWCE